MLRWFCKRLNPIGRGLLATAVSLWLVAAVAPCAMAQPRSAESVPAPCSMSMSKSMAYADMADMKDCGPVTAVNCKLPDINSPLVAALGDFTTTPVLLTTLPVSILLPQNRQPSRHDFFTPDIPAPPLHIQHLTLIL